MSEEQVTGEIAGANRLLDTIIGHLKAGDDSVVVDELALLHYGEIASLLEALSPELRQRLWDLIPAQIEGEVLPHLHEKAQASILFKMDDEEVVAAATVMEVNALAQVIDNLSEDLTETVLQSLDEDHRQRLEASMAFTEGTAGRIMNSDVISVRADVTLAVVLRYLRRFPALPPHTDNLMVTDEAGLYLGSVAIADAITGQPDVRVSEVMHSDADWVTVDASEQKIAQMFERRDLISLAVVDEGGMLLGRITVEDAIQIIRSQADHALLASAGLKEEEDLFAPVVPSALRRGLWLGINLVTVFMAAWVIGRFEEVLDKIVVLAVLMPVVSSMGGIAGSQTLTLTIRGMTLGQVSKTNLRWLTNKEVLVGLLNGVVWSLVVGIVTFAWFQQMGIALIIAAAMVLNLFVAALSGVLIPVVLERFGIDPALSGAVVLTTVTDIVGFLSFLGLATWFLI